MWNFTVVCEISRIKPMSGSDLPSSTQRMQSASRGVSSLPGLVPGIHVLKSIAARKTWMAGDQPGDDEIVLARGNWLEKV
jgi:hypothetical protein